MDCHHFNIEGLNFYCWLHSGSAGRLDLARNFGGKTTPPAAFRHSRAHCLSWCLILAQTLCFSHRYNAIDAAGSCFERVCSNFSVCTAQSSRRLVSPLRWHLLTIPGVCRAGVSALLLPCSFFRGLEIAAAGWVLRTPMLTEGEIFPSMQLPSYLFSAHAQGRESTTVGRGGGCWLWFL